MEIKNFLDSSYTPFHVIRNAVEFLENSGFRRYTGERIESGDRLYITKNDSALIAFTVGNKENYSFNIAVSHTDSPCLKIKGNALLPSAEGKKLNVEKYGGLILYGMLDIPLKIAGRVLMRNGSRIESKLVESDFFINIPSQSIHQNSGVNENFSLNVQTDMGPLIGEASDVYSLFGKDIIDADLFVVPAVQAFESGVGAEYLVSPRIDNLTSVYSCLKGIAKCRPQGVSVACLFDNEEIGSLTKQGARSAFLTETLHAINTSLGFGEAEYIAAKNNGFILSVDNGHAVHQAHPEKSDPSERVYLNRGIVIKHHVNYSTDGFSSAVFKAILDNNGIDYQDFYNRSDLRCGSTVGLFASAELQMQACDIGLAQLAMHSPLETVGKKISTK